VGLFLVSRVRRGIRRRLKTIRDAESALAHRVWEGVSSMPKREMAAFVLQNLAEGFARGMVKEMRNKS